jgi:hypothetical protein
VVYYVLQRRFDEREEKLKNIKQNISMAQVKKDPCKLLGSSHHI